MTLTSAPRFQRAEHALSQDSARRLMLTLAGQPEGLRQVVTHGAAAALADALDCTAYHDWPAANAAGAEDRRLQVNIGCGVWQAHGPRLSLSLSRGPPPAGGAGAAGAGP